MPARETIIFDLGGVLIDWNPRYLYRKIFTSEIEVTWFLETVCTQAWNEQQDAGRPFAEAMDELISKFPSYEQAIRAWLSRWDETVGGPIEGTVEVLRSIKNSNQYQLLSLTNWSAETFPWAMNHFDFLHWFEGIVVSGIEKTLKPQSKFFQILLDRYSVDPRKTLFIDDNLTNVEAARLLGMDCIHFIAATQLIDELKIRGVVTKDSESI